MSQQIMKVGVILLCGIGLAMLVPVTAAVVMDFIKAMKEIFCEGNDGEE
jgi:hypothetical protein